MAVTETTTIGWGSRLGSSVKGILVGLALFVIGFPVLFWNEGNAVKTRKALEEGEAACVAVESNAAVDPDNNGKLVHMSGLADTQEVLADAPFGVSERAIRLRRKVEMYQWQEDAHTTEKKNVGGSVTKTTTYSYRQVWAANAIPSGGFKEPGHDNPAAMPCASETWQAEKVSFGAFRLSPDQIERIGGDRAYTFGADYACPVADAVADPSGGVVYIPAAAVGPHDVAASPQVGDVRVTFSVVLPHDVSLVAKQSGDTFTAYTAKNGRRVSLLADGLKDKDEMFASAQSANDTMAWIIRLGGFLLMFIGVSMVLKPLAVLADVLPVLGNIVGVGIGLVAFAVAAPCALVTIAVAWFFYRPVLAVALLAAAAAIVYWAWSRRKAKKTTPAAG